MKNFNLFLPKISRFFSSYEEFIKTSKVKGIIGEIDFHIGRSDLQNLSQNVKDLMYRDLVIGNLSDRYILDKPIDILSRSVVGKYVYTRNDIQSSYLSNNPYDFSISDSSNKDAIKVEVTNEETLYDIIVDHYKFVYDENTDTFKRIYDFNEIRKRFEKERIRFEILRDIGDEFDLIADQSKLILDLIGAVNLDSNKRESLIQTQLKILDIVRKHYD